MPGNREQNKLNFFRYNVMLHGVSVSILTNDEGSSKKSSCEIDKLTFYIYIFSSFLLAIPKTLQYKYVYLFVAIASVIGNANGFAVNPSFQEAGRKKNESIEKSFSYERLSSAIYLTNFPCFFRCFFASTLDIRRFNLKHQRVILG